MIPWYINVQRRKSNQGFTHSQMTSQFSEFIWHRTKIVSRWPHNICKNLTKKRSFTTDAWMSPAPLPEVHWTEEYGGAGTLEPIPCPRAGPCTEPVGAVQTEPVPLYNLYGPCVSWRPHQCHPLNSANNVTQYRPIVSHWVPVLTRLSYNCAHLRSKKESWIWMWQRVKKRRYGLILGSEWGVTAWY